MSKKKSSYFAPLVSLACVIDAPGNYLTRSGEVVSITQVSQKYAHDFGNVGTYSGGIVDQWHRSGRIFAGTETQNDIVGKAS